MLKKLQKVFGGDSKDNGADETINSISPEWVVMVDEPIKNIITRLGNTSVIPVIHGEGGQLEDSDGFVADAEHILYVVYHNYLKPNGITSLIEGDENPFIFGKKAAKVIIHTYIFEMVNQAVRDRIIANEMSFPIKGFIDDIFITAAVLDQEHSLVDSPTV